QRNKKKAPVVNPIPVPKIGLVPPVQLVQPVPVLAPLNLPPVNPTNPLPQQNDEEDDMAHVMYPVFNGTNPRNWIADMEIAFTANNIDAAANSRKIGLAIIHSGIAKQWNTVL